MFFRWMKICTFALLVQVSAHTTLAETIPADKQLQASSDNSNYNMTPSMFAIYAWKAMKFCAQVKTNQATTQALEIAVRSIAQSSETLISAIQFDNLANSVFEECSTGLGITTAPAKFYANLNALTCELLIEKLKMNLGPQSIEEALKMSRTCGLEI